MSFEGSGSFQPTQPDVDFTDVDELLEDMRDLEGKALEIIDNGMEEGAKIIVDTGKEYGHKWTGEMTRTFHYIKIDWAFYQALSDMSYTVIETNRAGNKGALGPHDFLTRTLNDFTGLKEFTIMSKTLDLIMQEIVIDRTKNIVPY